MRYKQMTRPIARLARQVARKTPQKPADGFAGAPRTPLSENSREATQQPAAAIGSAAWARAKLIKEG